jgi:hypothetical protein
MADGVELGNRPREVTAAARNAPVVVMGYSGSGAERLRSALSWFPELACTQGTGILPLCHLAVTAWQAVEERDGAGMSPLAAASVRALCGGLVTAILAREGASRWCELSSAPTAVVQTFVNLYPGARFLLVHRRVDAVVRTVIGSGSWGLEGREFAPYVSAYPANPVAAVAAYWATHTAEQLEFERANPEACHRVRAGDLAGDSARVLPEISDFLALDGESLPPPHTLDDDWDGHADMGAPVADPVLPLDRIPGPLLARVNDLHRSLGYPPVTAGTLTR